METPTSRSSSSRSLGPWSISSFHRLEPPYDHTRVRFRKMTVLDTYRTSSEETFRFWLVPSVLAVKASGFTGPAELYSWIAPGIHLRIGNRKTDSPKRSEERRAGHRHH